jgi:hypothetical protein
MKTYPVYMEGYVDQGGRGTAHFVGYGSGETFAEAAKDACIKAYGEKETNKYFSGCGDSATYWGCGLYDNYEEAARAFG